MIYLQLYIEFFLTGLFSIGGGLATLPFLNDMGNRTGWFTAHQLADMLAVSESTPGAIGINMATYVGYHTGGLIGDIAATLGLVTPGIVIILLIAGFMRNFKDNFFVQSAMYGLRAASVGLVAAALYSVAEIALLNGSPSAMAEAGTEPFEWVNWKAVIYATVLYIVMKRFPKVHPVVFILASAVVGIFAGHIIYS